MATVMLQSVNNLIFMPPFTDLEGKKIIYDTVCFKSSLYEFSSTWFVQMLHYFSFTIQLALLSVFNIKLKNFAFDT